MENAKLLKLKCLYTLVDKDKKIILPDIQRDFEWKP